MEDKLTFEELYAAYLLCVKNKKKKNGTYDFVNDELCQNLIILLDELNNRTYVPKASNCYVITDPALREIYAAQFSDRIVQHFYMSQINDILDDSLVDSCSSCRVGKGTDYALGLLKKYIMEVSDYGKKDCYYLKIDLSGYFMSIDRKQVSDKFYNLIDTKYKGKHKNLLLYLTSIIFKNNPSLNCNYKCSDTIRNIIPDRRKLNKESRFGMAIGNLAAQAASNLNLNDFDKFVINDLNLNKYIRYVDDIVIISNDKNKLINSLFIIKDKLKESNQIINKKKTKINTVYTGVSFLGKITYPYGYQKPSKKVIIRTYNKGYNIKYNNINNLISKVNSQIGSLKRYNCKKLIINYSKIVLDRSNDIYFDINKLIFKKIYNLYKKTTLFI